MDRATVRGSLRRGRVVGVLVFGGALGVAQTARAEPHETVSGAAVTRVVVGPGEVAWSDLSAPKTPGAYAVRIHVPAGAGEAIEIPHCNGRGRVLVDGTVKDAGSKGPLVVRFDRADDASPRDHDVVVEILASAYEKRIACSYAPRVGAVVRSTEGLSMLRFASPHAKSGGGEAVVFVPGGHDATKPSAVLVGTHPWNGTPWTYAAYAELLEEAGRRDVVLLMPNGLGNSLYTENAEDEVMRAIDALSKTIAVDAARVSIWGASMGGAGATTIAFHRPDRFAFVASYFGDSKYDLTTYVKSLIPNDAAARKVNALDVLENARHLPVWLIHGEEDRSSPIAQSTMLASAMKKAGFRVDFEREPKMGHEGPLVVKYVRRVVERAESARAPLHPERVSFRSVRAIDTQAYGVRIVRAGEGDAFVDIERRADGIRLLRAEGVREVLLEAGALGGSRTTPILPGSVPVRWAP